MCNSNCGASGPILSRCREQQDLSTLLRCSVPPAGGLQRKSFDDLLIRGRRGSPPCPFPRFRSMDTSFHNTDSHENAPCGRRCIVIFLWAFEVLSGRLFHVDSFPCRVPLSVILNSCRSLKCSWRQLSGAVSPSSACA